jgi:endoplasmic reticulum Man9GlcNAc2 1,2-alpha-mannosidase
MMLVTYYGTQKADSGGKYSNPQLFLFTTCSPETIESLFVAYRLTGDDRYREYGWKIFQSIEKYCRLESGGYTSILNADDAQSERIDKMETFFLVRFVYRYLM